MAKKRVHEIAKEQGLTSKEVIKALTDAGVYVRAASSAVEERDIRRAFPNGAKAPEAPKAKPADGSNTRSISPPWNARCKRNQSRRLPSRGRQIPRAMF